MILSLLTVALAWETHVDAAAPWSSLDVPAGQPLNEHERLLETAIRSIDTSWSLAIGQGSDDEDRLLLFDLNSTWIRHDEIPAFDADTETFVHERRVPRITTVAGLPDVSFTVLDWANRNTFCPAVPEGGNRRDLCHDYGGWLGAGLNATHFGALAAGMYDRHHQIALREAANAKEIHDVLARGGILFTLPDGSVWHEDAVHEAEQLALIFEATGQHYLQDRLSVGHMFSRWGSGEYSDWLAVTDEDFLLHAQAVGLTAAVTHGSYAATEAADGMNFPMEGAPAQWRYVTPTFGVSGTEDGIGDDLEGSLVAGTTPNGVGNYAVQRSLMTTCTAGGLRQVAAAFRQNTDGTYGTDGVDLSTLGAEEDPSIASTTGFDPASTPACTEAWVTNESYFRGAELPTADQAMSKLVIKMIGKPELGTLPEASGFVRVGKGLVLNRAKALVNMIRDPAGVESAKDGIEFDADGFFVPNHKYDVPSWVEPADLSSLPAEDDEGQDLRTLDGLFVNAHPERTCGEYQTILEDLRAAASDPNHDERDRAAAACAVFASRLYKGTDPAYEGAYAELAGTWHPHVEAGDAESFEPYCAYFDGPEVIVPIITADASDDSRPYYLHPGYVTEPGELMSTNDTLASLESWCRADPVIDVIDDQDTAAILGTLDADRFVRLNGRNLGFRTTNGEIGVVEMQDIAGLWQPIQVWDSATGFIGGWGDTYMLDVVAPLAEAGFPTDAVSTMTPDLIKAVEPTRYPLRVTRANDPDASSTFLADGAQSPHPVNLALQPSWVELAVDPLPPDATEAAFWVIRPDQHQDEIERLSLGFWRVEADGSYTNLDIPFTERDDEFPENSSPVTWTPLPDVLGIHVDLAGNGLDPAIFSGDVVLFYAYH